jgi:RNA polymerase sigma-70 factor, ECF subfamily
VARFLVSIRRSRLTPNLIPQVMKINGQPGIINIVDGEPHSIFCFDFAGKIIQSIFAVVNPVKLKAVQSRLHCWGDGMNATQT